MLIPLIDADEQCGAKAANLAHLLRAGFAVPPGVVVLEVLSGDSWVPELRAALRDAGAAPVAVRSSAVGEDGAVASFAGQLHSTLDLTEPAQVIDQVRRAARSGVGPEAVAYAARMGHEPATVVPVIVQALVAAEVAGVMFTRHPVTGSQTMVIEAGRGLGGNVVDGTMTPWVWTVEDHTITHQAGDLFPPLIPRQVLQLAALALRIEALFGCPQDIEWAIADGTTWVLQSRPITASPITASPVATIPGAARSDGRAAGRVLATGTPASPGAAEGFVRIVHGFDDFARFQAGEVLVCRTTSPAWTPLLARAAAVVTEIGGLLAHAAIVAREFGIPAVLTAEKAMSALTDGQHVVVDGTAGTITTTQGSGER
ncbi:PEP/pyruvate-binding domain-containing protein [Arthrobacter sp. Soc17.1.1.1]|uniref:PEP/pyruvate-binding domain-containing protein n=1 Tax=Arthrobacter sp. Soc17.1.1.1 TaxID=3121277 RepID=UPI002FE43919